MIKEDRINEYINQLKNEFKGRYNVRGVALNIYKELSFDIDMINVDYLIEDKVIFRTRIDIDGGRYSTRAIGNNGKYLGLNKGDFDGILDDRLLTDIVNTYGIVVDYKDNFKRLESLLDDLGISIGKNIGKGMGNNDIYWSVVSNYDGVDIDVVINQIPQSIHKSWDDLESGTLRECLLTIKGLLDNLIKYKEHYKQLRDGIFRQRKDIQDNLFNELL